MEAPSSQTGGLRVEAASAIYDEELRSHACKHMPSQPVFKPSFKSRAGSSWLPRPPTRSRASVAAPETCI
jgi:hypothetical protein